MDYGEKALELKQGGCNCAQSVICALCDKTGLDAAQAKAMATALGGGLRCGEACGAFCGAALSLGLTIGADGKGSPDAPVAVKAKEFAEDFKEKFGALRCADLMQINGGDKSKCIEYVVYSARLAAALIDEEK